MDLKDQSTNITCISLDILFDIMWSATGVYTTNGLINYAFQICSSAVDEEFDLVIYNSIEDKELWRTKDLQCNSQG